MKSLVELKLNLYYNMLGGNELNFIHLSNGIKSLALLETIYLNI